MKKPSDVFKQIRMQEDLRQWFDKDHPEGGWKRINSKGEAVGPCAREPGEPKPKCMSNEKRAKLSKKERAAAVATKRKHDPNPERKGKPINVSNFGKGKISEEMENLEEKNVPTSPEKWAQAKAQAKAKFDVYPSAYANGWAAKKYKEMGGGWKSVSEAVKDKFDIGEYDQEGDMAKSDLRSIIANAQKMHDMLEDADNLPEWVQSKITKAEDYISTVANYMTAEMNEESELQESGGDVVYKKGDNHIEKYGEDSFALYKDGKKAKYYTSIAAAKEAMNEEVVVEEDIKSARIIKALYKRKGVMKEESEQLDELSKDTLKSYRVKSIGRAGEFENKGYEAAKKGGGAGSDKADRLFNKADAVTAARKRAQEKMKEEVEQIEEGYTVGEKTPNKQGGHNQDVHYNGKKIGHIESYSHRTGMRYGSVHQSSGDGSAGMRSHQEAMADLKSIHKNHMSSVKEEVELEEGKMKDIATNAAENKRLGSWRVETPWMKAKDTVTDKSGAKHTAMSRARDLARKAARKNVKESVSITESRLADIVREAADRAKKKKKEETKKSDDTFQPEPELSSQIIRND